MLLLSATDLCKTYGLQNIFDHISVNIDSGDKIGLLGVNGTGKSTLLRVLAGLEQADSGEIQTSNQLVLEYLPQQPEFDSEATVLEQIFRGTSPVMQLLREYTLTLEQLELAQNDEALTEKLMQLGNQMDAQNAWQLESEAKAVLNKLGIRDYSAKVGNLSGGQQKRIALAGVLIRPCNLLILDEPTNHLDYEAIDYLEEYLKTKNCALLMVTHDRYFLDRVTNRILELDQAKIFGYQGNYETFLELKTEREDSERRSREKAYALYKQELAWMRKGAEARRTKQKARIDRFYELEDSLVFKEDEKLEMDLQHSRLGKKIIELDGVAKSFDEIVCIRDFTYHMIRDDRIGIVGKNGLGKSTLLNLLAGDIFCDKGSVVRGETVRIGYYTQNNRDLPEDMKVIDYVREKGEYIKSNDGTMISAAKMLERFLFSGGKQHGLIRALSGGEKRRLYLLGVLMEDVNVLLLDEPTNDLDIQTLQVLEDFIDHFAGPIVTVSHDRYFLDRIARKIFSFEGDGNVVVYAGNYSDYLAKKAERAQDNPIISETVKKEDTRIKQQKLKFSYKEEKEYAVIEDEIALLEERILQCDIEMAANSSDFAKLNEIAKQKEAMEMELLEKMERWEFLAEKAEQIAAQQ